MSIVINKHSIVEKLADALSVLHPQNVFIKFEDEQSSIEIKVTSSVFENIDQNERINMVLDNISEVLYTDLLDFEALIIPLTENEIT